ncbi:ACYP2 [Symbiodinium microadriaticum]|nr:ACYP2 [Symbiodinium microadriaticum]
MEEYAENECQSDQLYSFDFEIFGKVQKVYFRKHTQEAATKLNLHGWVKNTKRGTVIGTAQGTQESVDELKKWLTTVGSPHSRIDRAEFKNERTIAELDFDGFDIDRK